jgi:hypothetical protein
VEGSRVAGAPTDVGPAWIDTYHGDRHVSQEKVADGRWITRAEAHDLAEQLGYELEVDDGVEPGSLECPRFGGHLSAWSALSGWAGRMRRYAEGIELSQAVLAGVPA